MLALFPVDILPLSGVLSATEGKKNELLGRACILVAVGLWCVSVECDADLDGRNNASRAPLFRLEIY